MKQKLMVMAVAGALSVPGLAAAQVKVSGKFGLALSNMKISDPTAARAAAGTHTSSTFLNDNTSVIQISASENLGGGLTFYGQYQFRPILDGSTSGPAGAVPSGSTTPINYMSLKSSSWGRVRAGSMSTWSAVGTGLSAGSSTQMSSSPILNYVQIAAGTSPTSFSSSRQSNTILYDTPDFKNGFSATLGWSSAPKAVDSDLTSAVRKGGAWYVMPSYNGGNWKVGYAYGDIKSEGAGSFGNLKAHKIWGTIKLAGIEFGATWAKVKATSQTTGAQIADVRKYIIPIRYRMGKNTFAAMIGKSGDDKIVAGDQTAKMTGLTYNYSFSKRTNMGVSWIKMTNSPAASFDLSSTTSTSYSSSGASAGLGEDQTLFTVSMNHSF